MMKKWAVLILCLLLCLPLLAGASYIPEYNLTIPLPNSLDVFTRDMEADHPLFSLYDATPAEVRQMLVEEGIYLKAIDIAGYFEIVLSVRSAQEDYLGLGLDELLARGGEDASLAYAGSIPFLVYQKGGSQSLVARTQIHGQAYELELQAYDRLNSRMKGLLLSIVAGMDFGLGQ